MYVRACIYDHAGTRARMHVSVYACTHACMRACMQHACGWLCKNAGRQAGMQVRLYVCMYAAGIRHGTMQLKTYTHLHAHMTHMYRAV